MAANPKFFLWKSGQLSLPFTSPRVSYSHSRTARTTAINESNYRRSTWYLIGQETNLLKSFCQKKKTNLLITYFLSMDKTSNGTKKYGKPKRTCSSLNESSWFLLPWCSRMLWHLYKKKAHLVNSDLSIMNPAVCRKTKILTDIRRLIKVQALTIAADKDHIFCVRWWH